MRVVDQSYEIKLLASFHDQAKLIEESGRIAYQSEENITEDSAPKFVSKIKNLGHTSVLEHSLMSVKFTTDRGVSHELVRHRLASFTQESTRYCNYGKDKFNGQVTFIRPVWEPVDVLGVWNKDLLDNGWLKDMYYSEQAYLRHLASGETPQQARAVLPNSLKTTIMVSANFREWLHIFRLRAISKAAHPQMRELMISLYEECRKEFPEIFSLGDPE